MSTILIAGEFKEETGALTPGSMAAAIEKALFDLAPPGPSEDQRGRRKLAAAIAQGVVGHLVGKVVEIKV